MTSTEFQDAVDAWWDSMAALLRATFRRPRRPPETLSVRYRLSPLVLPARGHVFMFHVHLCVTWRSTGISERRLRRAAARYAPKVRHDVARSVADITRTFHPHQAGELEAALNAELAGTPRNVSAGSAEIRANADVRVRLDDDVKRQLRAVYLDQITAEGRHDAELRRVQLVDELTDRWAALIERLRTTSIGQAAARLTDTDLATILDGLVVDQRSTVTELVDRLATAVDSSNRVGTPLEPHEADEIIELLNEALREAAAQKPENAGRVPGARHNGHAPGSARRTW